MMASPQNTDYKAYYRNRRVMITGGLGFIGSNLAHQLVALGADVLLVDSLIPDYGGNLFNIAGIEKQGHCCSCYAIIDDTDICGNENAWLHAQQHVLARLGACNRHFSG